MRAPSVPPAKIRSMTFAAMCLALALTLPFLTGQIPQIGNALCPMHIPILLAGFLCGPWWAAMAGLLAPYLRNLIFGVPVFLMAISMGFELATYGIVSGLLYRRLPKRPISIYTSLLAAMVAGRIVWGISRLLLSGVAGQAFTWSLFLAGAFTTAIPGILVQILLIPVVILSLRKANIFS